MSTDTKTILSTKIKDLNTQSFMDQVLDSLKDISRKIRISQDMASYSQENIDDCTFALSCLKDISIMLSYMPDVKNKGK